jgi:hypothetical protein
MEIPLANIFMEEEETKDVSEEESTEEEIDNDSEEETSVEKLKDEIKKLKDKEHNFGEVRKMLDEEKSKRKELEDKLKGKETEEQSKEKEEVEKIKKEYMSETLNELSDEEEVKKKVLYHYERIKDEATTKDEIAKKMKDAYILATRDEKVDPLLKAHNADTQGVEPTNVRDNETEKSKEIRKGLRLTDDDVGKYGKDGWKPEYLSKDKLFK